MAIEASGRPQAHQVLATLSYGDAISNEVLGIQDVLRRAGYDSRIYIQTVDPKVEDLTDAYRYLLDDTNPETLLIHHFSIGSHASRLAFALSSRMILVYHNITPPSYFVGVNPTLVQLCYSGRRELQAYAPRCDLALGDSEFNRRELEDMRFPRTGVLPVVPSFDHLDVPPNRLLATDFDDNLTNIFCVGRVIPNKRIEDVIRFFHAYRLKYNPASRLVIVGAHAGFEDYVSSLYELIARLGTPDVHLVGHVSNEELTALYDVADLLLSASEHEGFCVPLVEAFHKGIPVVAFAATAVPGHHGRRGSPLRPQGPVSRRVAHARGPVGCDAAGRDRAQPGRGARSVDTEGLRGHVVGLRGSGATVTQGRPTAAHTRLLAAVREPRRARGASAPPTGGVSCVTKASEGQKETGDTRTHEAVSFVTWSSTNGSRRRMRVTPSGTAPVASEPFSAVRAIPPRSLP